MDNFRQFVEKFNRAEELLYPYPTGICKVDLNTLESNIKKLQDFGDLKAGKKLKFLLPVKGNGYGSGMIPVAKFVDKKKLCDYLGVAHIQEAHELKKEKIKTPILILAQSFLGPEQISYIVKNNIEKTISDISLLKTLDTDAKKQNKTASIHLKVDTGMGRLGVLAKDIPSIVKEIQKCNHVRLKGVMTHFPVADSPLPKDIAYTQRQITNFEDVKKQILSITKNNDIIFHAANSGGTLEHPSSLFDMIRPGIATYGYPEPYGNGLSLKLEPVMQITSHISLIKSYPKGHSIGYGRTYVSAGKELVGVVPIGYADGLDRRLGGGTFTPILNKKKTLSVGRISMDQFCVKVGRKTKEGDEIILLGKSGKLSNTAQDIAGKIGTISYEVLCNLGNSKRMRHEYFYQ